MKLSIHAYVEIRKFFMNVSLAFVVFTLIQPFAQDKLNPKLLVIGICGVVVFFALGVYFLNIGGGDES